MRTENDTSLWRGLQICQSRDGYRFSIDSPILAHHVRLEPGGVGVDLGSGCGVIALILAHRFPDAKIYGVEIQEELAQLAVRNAELNGMEDRVQILHGDMKRAGSLIGSGVADVVCTNPPYRPVGAGRLSPNSQRAVAKHELTGTLSDVIAAARGLLKPSGVFWMVYPAARLVDAVTRMRAYRLEPKQLRFVHSRSGSAAELVVVKACKGGSPGVSVLPPLVTHNGDGSLTEGMAALVRDRG